MRNYFRTALSLKVFTLLCVFCTALLTSVVLCSVSCSPAYDLFYKVQDNVILHARRGESYMQSGRYDEAILEFQIALELNPYSSFSASIFNNLGIAFRHQKNYPVAITSFHRSIRLQPHFEIYYRNLIQTYSDAGQLLAAKHRFHEVLELNPRDAEAWYLLGLIFERDGESGKARTAFSNFVTLEPNSRLTVSAKQHL